MKDFFNKMIEVRDIAHQIHLTKSDSQSKHEALGEFYDSLTKNLDLYIEVYQGQFGLVDNFGEFESVDFSDHVGYFESFAKSIRDLDVVDDASHLTSILDDISISVYKLLFKLKYLS